MVNRPTSPSTTVIIDDDPLDPQQPTPSEVQGEAEVERTLFDFRTSCSITVSSNGRSVTTAPPLNQEDLEMHMDPNASGVQPSSPVSSIDDEMEIDELEPDTRAGIPREISPTVSDFRDSNPRSRKHSTDRETVPSDVSVHDIDIEEKSASTSVPQPEDDSAKLFDTEDGVAIASESIKPNNFYGKVAKKSKGLQKAELRLEPIPMDVEDDEMDHLTAVDEQPSYVSAF